MADALERLKILLSSSTPIVVMETVEEMRAVRLVRAACSSLNLATFEWSIASGLVRCGSDVGELVPETGPSAFAPAHNANQSGAQALYNSKEPEQALSNLEAMSVEAAFVLKDFHRHMDDPVVVRRLRDVGQKFSANRRTVIITAPSITIRSTGPRAGCSLSHSCSWIAVKKSGSSEGAWPAGLAGAQRRSTS